MFVIGIIHDLVKKYDNLGIQLVSIGVGIFMLVWTIYLLAHLPMNCH
jgi:hypothetical protein